MKLDISQVKVVQAAAWSDPSLFVADYVNNFHFNFISFVVHPPPSLQRQVIIVVTSQIRDLQDS